MKDLKFAVLGAGHGGKAIAAHLAIKGFSVKPQYSSYNEDPFNNGRCIHRFLLRPIQII